MALVFGNEFAQTGQILQIFLVITMINFIAVNFGYPAFAGIGKIHIVNQAVIVGAFIQLFCLAILYFSGNISAINVLFQV